MLNRLLPALAFRDRLDGAVKVERYDGAYWKSLDDGQKLPG